MEWLLKTNMEKLRYHANAAEKAQMQIEAFEEQAAITGGGMQYGRMQRNDNTLLPDGYMANVLLRDNHEYRTLVGARNAHQAQVAMYAALIMAGIRATGYGRHSTDGQHFELKALETLA